MNNIIRSRKIIDERFIRKGGAGLRFLSLFVFLGMIFYCFSVMAEDVQGDVHAGEEAQGDVHVGEEVQGDVHVGEEVQGDVRVGEEVQGDVHVGEDSVVVSHKESGESLEDEGSNDGEVKAGVEDSKGSQLPGFQAFKKSQSLALNPNVSTLSQRVWSEILTGSIAFSMSSVLFWVSISRPVFKKYGLKGMDAVSPIMILSVAAATGAGVHLGGYLADNIGSCWGAYLGTLGGGVVALLIDSASHFYNNKKGDDKEKREENKRDRRKIRTSAYISSPILMLVGGLLGYELTHRSRLNELKASDTYSVVPVFDVNDDYKGVGLRMIF